VNAVNLIWVTSVTAERETEESPPFFARRALLPSPAQLSDLTGGVGSNLWAIGPSYRHPAISPVSFG